MQSLHCILQKCDSANACEWKLLQHCGKKLKINIRTAQKKWKKRESLKVNCEYVKKNYVILNAHQVHALNADCNSFFNSLLWFCYIF